jgi:hypothetical protein
MATSLISKKWCEGCGKWLVIVVFRYCLPALWFLRESMRWEGDFCKAGLQDWIRWIGEKGGRKSVACLAGTGGREV